MSGITYSALQAAPPARAVAAWRESLRQEDERAGRHGAAAGGPELRAPAWVGMIAIFAAFLCLLFTVTGIWMLIGGDSAGGVGLVAAVVLAAVTGTVLWLELSRRVRTVAEGWEQPYQLMTFAHDNGFDAAPVSDPADLPGRIFGRGLVGNRVRHDLIAWTQGGRQCHVATESWHSGNPPGGGPPEDRGSRRYLAVLLAEEPLPHESFMGELGTEEDAATVLTTEVQTLLGRGTPPWEAELTGGWFIAYQHLEVDPLDVEVWERVFALVDALPPASVPAP